MGKSKRNRRKAHRQATPDPTAVQESANSVKPGRSKHFVVISVITLAILVGLYVLFHGGKNNPSTGGISSPQTSQSSLPTVQAGGSQSLSPSGSVDLQPSSAGPSVGSVQ